MFSFTSWDYVLVKRMASPVRCERAIYCKMFQIIIHNLSFLEDLYGSSKNKRSSFLYNNRRDSGDKELNPNVNYVK